MPELRLRFRCACARDGCRALVCGRQRPGTADGTCFVTLEDEYGMVNVVVWSRDCDRQRVTIVTSRFLLVDAVIEREGLVVHAIARAVMGVSPDAGTFEGGAPEAREAQMLFPFAGRNFHFSLRTMKSSFQAPCAGPAGGGPGLSFRESMHRPE